MRATWYILEDGSTVDPADCSPDDAGSLTHNSGVKVQMRSHDCPMSTGVDVDDSGKPPFAGKGDHDGDGKAGGAAAPAHAPKPKDMQAAKPAQGYKTRQTRTRR